MTARRSKTEDTSSKSEQTLHLFVLFRLFACRRSLLLGHETTSPPPKFGCLPCAAFASLPDSPTPAFTRPRIPPPSPPRTLHCTANHHVSSALLRPAAEIDDAPPSAAHRYMPSGRFAFCSNVRRIQAKMSALHPIATTAPTHPQSADQAETSASHQPTQRTD